MHTMMHRDFLTRMGIHVFGWAGEPVSGPSANPDWEKDSPWYVGYYDSGNYFFYVMDTFELHNVATRFVSQLNGGHQL